MLMKGGGGGGGGLVVDLEIHCSKTTNRLGQLKTCFAPGQVSSQATSKQNAR